MELISAVARGFNSVYIHINHGLTRLLILHNEDIPAEAFSSAWDSWSHVATISWGVNTNGELYFEITGTRGGRADTFSPSDRRVIFERLRNWLISNRYVNESWPGVESATDLEQSTFGQWYSERIPMPANCGSYTCPACTLPQDSILRILHPERSNPPSTRSEAANVTTWIRDVNLQGPGPRTCDADGCDTRLRYDSRSARAAIMWPDGGGTSTYLCRDHYNDSNALSNATVITMERNGEELQLQWCGGCGYFAVIHEACTDDFVNTHRRRYCIDCVERSTYICDSCDEEGNELLDIGAGYDDDDYMLCPSCMKSSWRINSYGYKPETIFHPELPGKMPLYTGMEIETCFSGRTVADTAAKTWAKELEIDRDFIYLKRDGSLSNGVEIVTHPFQLEWAKENFPFTAFDKLVRNYGALETDRSAGTHIHMSKDAFDNALMWKFVQMHDRLSSFLGQLGGRGTDAGYGNFGSMSQLRKDAKELALQKGQPIRGINRSSALNFNPPTTVEVRYPAGGSSGRLVRKNMELVWALYHFADEISVTNVREGVIDDPGYFIFWLNQERENFPALFEYAQSIIPGPREFERSN